MKDCPAISENRKEGKERQGTNSGFRLGTAQKDLDTMLPPALPLNFKDKLKVFKELDSSSVDGKANSKNAKTGEGKEQLQEEGSDTSKAATKG